MKIVVLKIICTAYMFIHRGNVPHVTQIYSFIYLFESDHRGLIQITDSKTKTELFTTDQSNY